MSNIINYLDKEIVKKLDDKSTNEIREILRKYYELKSLDRGKSEIELILMIFEDNLSLEDIAARVNLSTRQVRRKRDHYISFFTKVIESYFKNIIRKSQSYKI